MKPSEYSPRRSPKSKSALVTEVTDGGRIVGAVVWSRNKNDSAFVEAADLNAVGHVLKKLSTRARKQDV